MFGNRNMSNCGLKHFADWHWVKIHKNKSKTIVIWLSGGMVPLYSLETIWNVDIFFTGEMHFQILYSEFSFWLLSVEKNRALKTI